MMSWKCPHCDEIAQMPAPKFLRDGREFMCSGCCKLTLIRLEPVRVEPDPMELVYVQPTREGHAPEPREEKE